MGKWRPTIPSRPRSEVRPDPLYCASHNPPLLYASVVAVVPLGTWSPHIEPHTQKQGRKERALSWQQCFVPELFGDSGARLNGALPLVHAERGCADSTGCPALHHLASRGLCSSTCISQRSQAAPAPPRHPLRAFLPLTERIEHTGRGTDISFHRAILLFTIP